MFDMSRAEFLETCAEVDQILSYSFDYNEVMIVEDEQGKVSKHYGMPQVVELKGALLTKHLELTFKDSIPF